MHAYSLEDYDMTERRNLAEMITRLFDLWHLKLSEQASLLGLSEQTRNTICGYKGGKKPIAKNRDLIDRIGHFLGIHKALRTLLPKNKELAYQWPTTKNKAFNNRTPVEVVLEEGFEGLLQVRYYLENQLV